MQPIGANMISPAVDMQGPRQCNRKLVASEIRSWAGIARCTLPEAARQQQQALGASHNITRRQH